MTLLFTFRLDTGRLKDIWCVAQTGEAFAMAAKEPEQTVQVSVLVPIVLCLPPAVEITIATTAVHGSIHFWFRGHGDWVIYIPLHLVLGGLGSRQWKCHWPEPTFTALSLLMFLLQVINSRDIVLSYCAKVCVMILHTCYSDNHCDKLHGKYSQCILNPIHVDEMILMWSLLSSLSLKLLN